MIINAVGCPYSGIDNLVYILNQAGIRTRSEGPDLVHDRRLVDRRIPYDCYETPNWIKNWMNKFEQNGYNDYMNLDSHFFHDAWGRACAMYTLEQKYPNVRFLIMLKDPRSIIGNWFHIEGTTGPEVTIENYKNTVVKIYAFMYKQAKLLKNKPIVMNHDLFLSGQYLTQIFEMFGIDNSLENIHKVQGFLKGAYVKTDMYEGDISEILSYQNRLKSYGV